MNPKQPFRPLFSPPYPLIVGVVKTPDELAKVKRGDCDIVELRVDAYAEGVHELTPQVPCDVPVLLTFRDATEGGYCVVAQHERIECVRRLLPMAAAVDWEIALLDDAGDLLEQMHASGIMLVASAHYFSGTPSVSELDALEQRALAAGADLVKVAFTPQNWEQVQAVAGWLTRSGHPRPVALMGMGPLAQESRLFLCKQGSALVYGYLGNSPSAPGQMSAEDCRKAFRRAQQQP